MLSSVFRGGLPNPLFVTKKTAAAMIHKTVAARRGRRYAAVPEGGLVRRHVWEHVDVFVPYLANTEHDTLYGISYCLLSASAAFGVIVEDI